MSIVNIGMAYADLWDFVPPGEMAQRAEQAGYHTFWVVDHALKVRLDPLTVLGAVSQCTSRLRVGTAVMALPYRHPYLVAKAAVSVDHLSNGRLTLGLGVGDLFHEFEALEIDRRVRGRQSDERLDIIRRLFHQERVSHHGEFHTFDDLTLLPRPIQRPGVPLWVGASWNDGFVDAVIRRAARYGDGFLSTNVPARYYAETRERIERQARASDRDPVAMRWGMQLWTNIGDSTEEGRLSGTGTMKARFGKTEIDYRQGTALGSAADCIETIEAYAAQGVTDFVLSVVSPPEIMAEQYERLGAEVLPHFAN